MAFQFLRKWQIWVGGAASAAAAAVPFFFSSQKVGGPQAVQMPSSDPRPPSAPAIEGTTCLCPTLPVFITAKDSVASGHVYDELNEDDLVAIFSNRVDKYGRSTGRVLIQLESADPGEI